MNDEELLRYSRHILLPQIGIEGQERLNHSSVLVVGAGGLGCPAALYLGASGIGRLIVSDGDVVDMTNLQRQIGHDTASIGTNKAASLGGRITAINPQVSVEAVQSRLGLEELFALVDRIDLVLDCSDNFQTRHAVNKACVALGKPLVSGAAIGFAGQLCVFDSKAPESPCYQCLFPDTEEEGLRCSEAGVVSPLVGVIGAMQALESIKLLAGAGQPAVGRLLLYDAEGGHVREVNVPRDHSCQVCGERARNLQRARDQA